MSEFDNLEALSNAELRAICIQHGLPNVPITDTSRKVLIKKLRAIATEPQAATKATKSNRRETIAAVQKVTPAAVAKPPEDETATRRANRRTIAATSTAEAQPPNKVFEVKITEKLAAPQEPAPAPAPVATRRRSVQRETAPPTPQPKPTVMQTIILDDDDEEDDVDSLLAIAADTAERQNYAGHRESPLPAAQRSRSSSFSQSEVVTTSLPSSNVRVMPPLIEQSHSAAFSEPFEPTARSSSIYQASSSTLASRPAAKPSMYGGSFGDVPLTSRQIHTSASLAREPTSSRYSSVLGTGSDFASPSARYSVPASRPVAAPPKHQYKEFSDDCDSGDQDDQGTFKTPYLSKFTRELEKLKGQPLSPAVTERRPAQRHTVYETPAHRRPIGQPTKPDDAVSEAFWNLWADLDRTYNIKLIFKFILLLVVLIFVYVMVTPD